jgi:putative methionine-R-sulfoxide reductase with GAF domain
MSMNSTTSLKPVQPSKRGFSFWRDLGFARKLYVAFGSLALLALVVGIVTNLGLNSVQTSYQRAIDDGGQLQTISLTLSNELLIARRNEMDFLLRWQDQGINTVNINYVIPNHTNVLAIKKSIDELTQFAPIVGAAFGDKYSQEQFEKDLAVLKASTDRYDQNFQATYQLIQEKGTQNTGLVGKFQKTAQDIEDRISRRDGLESLVITLLQIRREENDYLLHEKQESIDQVHASVTELRQQILASEQLTATEKTDLLALTEKYVSGFDTLVEKNIKIAASIQAFRAAAGTMQPIVAKVTNAGVEMSQINTATAKTTSVQTVIFSNLTLVIALLVALFLSVALSRQITRPVLQLTSTAREIATGKFDVRADVNSLDEIGTLAQTFNIMTSRLGEAFNEVRHQTLAVRTSAEVSRRLSTILERKELVTAVVNQVNNAFGYYHTQIYFYDAANENLVMAGGTGEAGEKMLAQFHKVAKGRGLVGRAADTNKAVLVSNISQNPEWLPNPLLPDTEAEIAIPISIHDEVLGVLDVQHNIVNGLQEEDVESLSAIANQIAVALQNIKSTENVIKRAAELQTVANISTVAATIGDVQKMLESVVHLTQRGFGLYHAHVFLYNENKAELGITACGWKEGDEHEGTHGTAVIPLEQEQSLVARAARTRQAVIVNDVHNEPGWLPNPLLPDTASELAVPLIVGDQLLGVLDVQSERLNAFSNEDASIQSTLASQVSTAMQNARSLSQSQRQAERETAVNLITQRIQSTTSVEAALQMAARELGHALGMKQTLVELDSTTLADEHKGSIHE